jgi:magnesium transporter
VIKIYWKETDSSPLQELSQPRAGCWIHIDEATSSELSVVKTWTGIDEAALSDCLDKYEIPRCEKNKDSLLVYARYPSDQEIGLYTSTFTLILGGEFFITISPHRSLLISNFFDQNVPFSTTQSSHLLMQLLMRMHQEFTGQIRRVRHNVLSAEKEMIKVESEDIASLTKNEEILNQYLASLTPMRSMLQNMAGPRFIGFYEKEKEFLDDLVNAFLQSEDVCNSVIKSIRSLRNAYQIIFTNNLHKTIKLLTALTIILSIPTMTASIYGMNIKLPFETSAFAFLIVLGLTGVLSAIALWIFKRRGWL